MPRRPTPPVAKPKAPAKRVKPAAMRVGKAGKKTAKKAVKKAAKPQPAKAAPQKAKAKAPVKATLALAAGKPAAKPIAKPAGAVLAQPAQSLKFPASAAPLPPPPATHLPRASESKTDWFARIARDYYRFLYATALPITRNNDDAEDAVQNAVMSGLRRLDQLTEPGAVVSWLAMITKNAALDVLRRKKRIPGGGGDSTVLPIAAPDEKSEYAVADDMRSVLANAIATLPLSYQEVVNARHFDGLEVEDIAKRFNVTQNSIRVRLFRAYEKLRESAQVRRALGLPAEPPAAGE